MKKIFFSLSLFGSAIETDAVREADQFFISDVLSEKKILVHNFKIFFVFFIFGKVFLGVLQNLHLKNIDTSAEQLQFTKII